MRVCKNLLRLLLLMILLAGTCAVPSFANGPEPIPLCDPSDPCPPPFPPHVN